MDAPTWAIRLCSRDYYLTAFNGGGRTTNSIHTDRKVTDGISSWEKFNIDQVAPGNFSFQTSDGTHYVSAVNGGGVANAEAIHTDATSVGPWETFNLVFQPADGTYAIQTPDGVHYVTAVHGGGRSAEAIHTDKTSVGPWEKFWLIYATPV